MSGLHLELIRDPMRRFPIVADPHSVRSAKIWHCKYKSLAPLGELLNLEELMIATFPDASFEFLEKLKNLRFLSIVHMPKIIDIAPLAKLSKLTSLSLSTLPGWDTSRKTTIIHSLEPLTAIPELAHLELFGICPPDQSLVPLEQCKHLQTARIAQYPQPETVRFFNKTKLVRQFNPTPSFL